MFQQPYAAPYRANRFKDDSYWAVLQEIFEAGHADCWLPQKGKLPKEERFSAGLLSLELALQSFSEGRTILVRHAERVHRDLQKIAADFYSVFNDPIDIQLYCTPMGQEGFDWHYDLEEVFVLQVSGEKEFWLLKNADPAPKTVDLKRALDLKNNSVGSVISCVLKAGDWLYIPAGYWHKAKALSNSFHMSVGVMSSTAYGRSKSK